MTEEAEGKAEKASLAEMRVVPTDDVPAYALMTGSVYVHLKLNDKLVKVKAPFDFFSPTELERFRPLKTFSFSAQTETEAKFREAARAIRALLAWKPDLIGNYGAVRIQLKCERVALAPASYETSDAILRLLAPLWEQGKVDPFHVGVFAQSFCEPLSGELLQECRERSIKTLERAVLCSSWAVFLGLHLGYANLGFLNQVRSRVFAETSGDEPEASGSGELDELVRLARSSLSGDQPACPGRPVTAPGIFKGFGRTSRKLAARFERVERLAADV